MTDLRIRRRTTESAVVVAVTGELDSSTAPEAQERIATAMTADHELVLDLSGVPYMSSAGLRMMLLVYRQAQTLNVPVALVGVQDGLLAIMEATGFLEFFTLADSVPDALRALDSTSEAAS